MARREFRLGSTPYLVYARTERELPWSGAGSPPATLAPRALALGPATDTILVKWTYGWSLRGPRAAPGLAAPARQGYPPTP